ncbi:MAG: DUF5977 domain-containing protein [Ferruginibacter sp.]
MGQATYTDQVDVLPPAPNAASIIKYGEAQINKNTGAPSVNVPLFTIKGSRLATNVSISYSSTGLKVDEIASRVGMGWNINAGGVVTRVVRGQPDELNTKHAPYATIGANWSTYSYMKRIASSGQSGGYDAEPDLFNFSFDGYSGSFVFDGNGNIQQVHKSGLKIATDFQTGATWNVKITNTEGVIYYFGGPGAIEKTKRTQTCGKSFDQYLPSSWYLKQIQHPNGEVLNFNYAAHTYSYDNGMVETNGPTTVGENCFASTINTCINVASTEGVILQSIISPSNAVVIFKYTSRQDCNDSLLSQVIFGGTAGPVGSFDLSYTNIVATSTNQPYYNKQLNTPYLTSLTENSSDNLLHKTHYFSYDSPDKRPARLSYSQDHWGYYNGKPNTTLIPFMGENMKLDYPYATGNREPDGMYARLGLLNKIVYPTGGFQMLFYEPNIYNETDDQSYATQHSYSDWVIGTSNWTAVTKTGSFSIDAGQIVDVSAICTASGSYETNHNFGKVQIMNSSSAVVFEKLLSPADGNQAYSFVMNTTGSYSFVITSYGSVIRTDATLKFKPVTTSLTKSEKITGGMRVAKIVTAASSEDVPVTKKYYYGTLTNLTTSSLAYQVAHPVYYAKSYCTVPSNGAMSGYVLSSSSSISLQFFGGSNISYQSVIQGNGNNFEGGGTETLFSTSSDNLGTILWNNDILNSPYSNYSSYYNGKVSSEAVLKKMPDNSLKRIKKTEYTYENDDESDKVVFGYSVVRRFPELATPDTTCIPSGGGYPSCATLMTDLLSTMDMVRYAVHSSFVYPKTETVTSYDENGENPVVVVTQKTYDNTQHYQVTSTSQVNSEGKKILQQYKYPKDYPANSTYTSMVSNNIITPVINAVSVIDNSPSANTPLSEVQVNYANMGSSNYVPASFEKAIKGNTLQQEGTIDSYDEKGNVLQFTGKNGIVSCIIWGYNKLYPVAQVTGATYASAVAQLTVTMTALQSMDGSSLLTELNHIRTGLPGAIVTTYTYKSQVGVTAIADANNKLSEYVYDNFGRLVTVKDQDGNAVKHNVYSYATPSASAGLTVYLNAEASSTKSCQTCISNYSAVAVTYTVPLGRYYSLVSQADANAQAQADIDANAQNYANKNAICIYQSNL